MNNRITVSIRWVSRFVALAACSLCGPAAIAQVYTVSEFPMANNGDGGSVMVHASDDNLYSISFTGGTGNPTTFLQRTATTGVSTLINFTGAGPWNSTASSASGPIASPDGNLLFQFNNSGGTATLIDHTTLAGSVSVIKTNSSIQGLFPIVDRDGQVWESTGGVVSKVNPTTGAVTSTFSDPGIAGIAMGRDGNVWFTELSANKVGFITPGGSVTTFTVPTAGASPAGIGLGPDGNMWFSEIASGAPKVGRITPAGVITEFATPPTDNSLIGGAPIPGPDGNIWVPAENDILKLTTAGAVTVITTPHVTPLPQGLALGSDGRIWFPEQSATVGAISGLSIPTPTNDNFANATALSGTSGFLFTNDYSATAEAGEPATAGVTPHRTLWWSWTAPSAGQMVVSTNGSSYDTVVGAYTGTALGALTPVAQSHIGGNGSSFVVFSAQAGTTYHFVVDGVNGVRGVLLLDWRLATSTAATDDLALTLSAPTTAFEGQNFNYVMTITNGGPGYGTNVKATLTLSANDTFVSASPGCTYNSGTRVVTCIQALLTGGAGPAVFTVTAVDTTTGTITGAATVSSDLTDPNLANNSATDTTTVALAPPGSGESDAPTLPEWAAILMGLLLLTITAKRGALRARR